MLSLRSRNSSTESSTSSVYESGGEDGGEDGGGGADGGDGGDDDDSESISDGRGSRTSSSADSRTFLIPAAGGGRAPVDLGTPLYVVIAQRRTSLTRDLGHATSAKRSDGPLYRSRIQFGGARYTIT